MLKRLYINNYKSLVNFELSLDSLSLFLGENGSGKTAVLEALRHIQVFLLTQKKAIDVFPASGVTRWSKSKVQSFELDIEDNDGLYAYELEIEHNYALKTAEVSKEKLSYNKRPLFDFSNGEALVYSDDHAAMFNYPIDRSKAPLGVFPLNDNFKKLSRFKQNLWNFLVLRLNPYAIEDFAEDEPSNVFLSWNGSNFASWYFYISRDQRKAIELTNELREVLVGFSHFKFLKLGENQSALLACFSDEGETYDYRLSELSDGQRMLIVLHTLLYIVRTGDHTLLCVDEPFNHLGLPEIQPWLVKLYEYCDLGHMRSILISHHPESIDYLADEVGYWFERDGQKPSRIRKITKDDTSPGVHLSELIKRGWLYAQEEES